MIHNAEVWLPGGGFADCWFQGFALHGRAKHTGSAGLSVSNAVSVWAVSKS